MSMLAPPRLAALQQMGPSACLSDNSHSSTSESGTSISHTSSNTSLGTHAAFKVPRGAQQPRLSTTYTLEAQEEQQRECAGPPVAKIKHKLRMLRKPQSSSSVKNHEHNRSWSLFAPSRVRPQEDSCTFNEGAGTGALAARRHSGPPPSAFPLSRLSRRNRPPRPVSGYGLDRSGSDRDRLGTDGSLANGGRFENRPTIPRPPMRKNKPLPARPISMSSPILPLQNAHAEASEDELADFNPGSCTNAPSPVGLPQPNTFHNTLPSFSQSDHEQDVSDGCYREYRASGPGFRPTSYAYPASISEHCQWYRTPVSMNSPSTTSPNLSWSQRLRRTVSMSFHKPKRASQTLIGSEASPIEDEGLRSTGVTHFYSTDTATSFAPYYTASESGHRSSLQLSHKRHSTGFVTHMPAFMSALSVNSLATNKLRKRQRAASQPFREQPGDAIDSSVKLQYVDPMTETALSGRAKSLSVNSWTREIKKTSNTVSDRPCMRRDAGTPPPVPPLPPEFGYEYALPPTHASADVTAHRIRAATVEKKKLLKPRRPDLSISLSMTSRNSTDREEKDVESKVAKTYNAPEHALLPPVEPLSPFHIDLILGDGQHHTFTGAKRSRSSPDLALTKRVALAHKVTLKSSTRAFSKAEVSVPPTETDILRDNRKYAGPSTVCESQRNLRDASILVDSEENHSHSQPNSLTEPLQEQETTQYPTSLDSDFSLSSECPSFLRSQSNRRWTLAVSETSEDKLVEELDRLRSVGWGLGFQGELFRKYPIRSSIYEDGAKGEKEGNERWEKEEIEEWNVARKALLVCREIVRTEMSYKEALEKLHRGETLKRPSPLLLQYLPALISASEAFATHLAQDPSAWGVSIAFIGVEDILEAAFVAWSGVVGGFLSSSSHSPSCNGQRRSSKLEKSLPASPSRTPSRTPVSPSSPTLVGSSTPATQQQGSWRVSMGAMSQLLAGSNETGIVRRTTKYLPSGLYFGGNGANSTSGNIKVPTVQDLAIQPTQRVMRYVLLYKDLLSSTPISSPARALVERALEGATRIAQRCNRAQDNAEFLL